MDLNLKIKPLSNVENLFLQKCLLPKSQFPPDIRPGSWCRCYYGDNFSLCQAFPRDDLTTSCCYLDKTVSSEGRAEGVLLSRIQVCEIVHPDVVKAIKITFVITEKLFSNNKNEKISLDYLRRIGQYYLQALHLKVKTRVEIKDLETLGVHAIYILEASMSEDSVFTIDDETSLEINDVQLLNTNVTTATFYEFGFEKAQQDLNDLLHVVEMQKNSWELRTSLNVLLVGTTGSGKSALAQRFITENHCSCFRITSNISGQYPGETEAKLRHKFSTIKTFVKQLKPRSPTVLLIEDLHLLCPVSKTDNSLRICAQFINLIDDLNASKIGVICLATTYAPGILNELTRRPGRFDREIAILAPTEQQRLQLFHALFSDSFYAIDVKEKITNQMLDMVAKQTQGYVVADLALLVRNIEQCLLKREHGDMQLVSTLKEVLKKSKPTSLHGVDVTVFKTNQRFDSIGGMQTLKRTLKVSILVGIKHQAAFQRFGLNLPKGLNIFRENGITPIQILLLLLSISRKSILLYGPPGCAKTTIAKCLATAANMTFISTSGAEVYSPYVGCAEKFISKIFDTARKHTPCLIFLDEIDSLVGRRSNDSKGDVQIRILSTLLTEMDGIVSNTRSDGSNHILVVAATNRPDMLDDALIRPGRFDKLIHVPAPDLRSRLAILKLYSERMAFGGDVDLDAIAVATENYSGADLCNLCNEAALHALTCSFDVDCIKMKDFEYVLHEQKSSLTNSQIQWYIDFEKSFGR